MDYSGYKTLAVSRDGRLLTLTINQPDRHNIVDSAMHRELARIFTDIAMDDDADVVIFTGAGSAFSAGGDIHWMQSCLEKPQGMADIAIEGRRIITSLLDLEKPLICRLNGDAIGLGATLALFCDIIIADETARIADPHVRVGLVAGDGGAIIWPHLIGAARAKAFLMTGDMLSASEAATMGLITKAVPGDQLDAEVERMTGKLLRGAQHAIRWTKLSVNLGLKQTVNAVLDASLGLEVASSLLPAHREGVIAFLEKRQPNFVPKS
ncbi:MAG: enoyl-CoA hydratase-related protein [Sphingobium sp.]|uniref:enoyl-CoA hydratase/isomerase family protein n=1 Tax=Sphingobium sp. TaxID=1912891 RepID=UPI0029AD689E|nr:enoyl-CoA hydratase-related protein [Sphingobium sp.]MDX3909561.1 enoyl-CoA hydratase-related protein [Sphingobium sp.]